MKINIRTTNMELTSAIKDYAEKKIGVLQKFIDAKESEIQADVEVGKTTRHHHTGDVFRAEALIRFPHHDKGIYSEAEKDNLYAAIDEVHDEMARELIKTKEKRISLFKKGARAFKKILPF